MGRRTDRQTEVHADGWTNGKTDRQNRRTDRLADKWANKRTNEGKNERTDKETSKWRGQTGGRMDGQTDEERTASDRLVPGVPVSAQSPSVCFSLSAAGAQHQLLVAYHLDGRAAEPGGECGEEDQGHVRSAHGQAAAGVHGRHEHAPGTAHHNSKLLYTRNVH